MPPQRNMQRTYNEGTLTLAIQATQSDAPDSIKHASRVFNVPETTLRRRRNGALPRRDWQPKSKKLGKLEEEALVRRILQLDQQGMGATKDMVRDMANGLLAERGGEPVGKHWVDNFKTRTPEVKLQRSRPYDRQRALNEDLRVITPWFALVANTKVKHGITDEDTYNFDETGFMIGIIQGQMVFTGSEKRGNPVSPLLKVVERLNRGIAMIGHDNVLMRQEMDELRKAVEVATEVRNRKRKCIKAAKTLTVGEVADLIAEREGGGQEEGREPVKRVRTQRRCVRSGETGHNARTCAVEIVDLSDSNEFE